MSGIDDGIPWAGGYANRLPQFRRAAELIVGRKPPDDNYVATVPDALRIDGLRVVFRVELTPKKEPNTAKIDVYNLSKNSRASIEGDKGPRVVLQAGYLGSVSQIFSGDSRTCITRHIGPDVITSIQCGDGERSFRFAEFRQSFKPGTSVKEIVSQVTKAMQLDPGNALQQAQKIAATYNSGATFSGRASDVLEEILKPHGYTYSIQGGRIEILAADEWLKEEGPLLNADSGLVGSPEWGTPEKKGKPALLKVRALLNGRFRPGIRFQLDALEVKGRFRCVKVSHSGDTHPVGGNSDWYTDMEVAPAQ